MRARENERGVGGSGRKGRQLWRKKEGGQNPGGRGVWQAQGEATISKVNECGPRIKQLVCSESIGANLAAPLKCGSFPEHSLDFLSLFFPLFFYLFRTRVGQGLVLGRGSSSCLSRRGPAINSTAKPTELSGS